MLCRSVCLSLLLQRSAIASTRQLRYEQAKHDHGLQCDSWIMLKCFRSRVMAGSPGRPSWTFLTTKAHMVDNLGTCRFHLNCKTALGVRRHLKKKPIKAKSNGYLLSVHGHAHLTHLVLVVSTRSALCCLLVSSAISIASKFAFSCKAPSANHN